MLSTLPKENPVEYIYTGTKFPLLKESKWKPHKSLIIVHAHADGTVLVRRKDWKGCDAQGNQQIVVLFKHLKRVAEKVVEAVPPPPLPLFMPAWSPPSQETPKPLGMKFDNDKVEHSLLPAGVLTNILRVLGFGKKKYAADNWKHVDNAKERYYNATMRHITSWWEGEKTDPETGENHLAHAACCILFLLWFDNQKDTGKN